MIAETQDGASRDAVAESQKSTRKKTVVGEPYALIQRYDFVVETGTGQVLHALKKESDVKTLAIFEYIWIWCKRIMAK